MDEEYNEGSDFRPSVKKGKKKHLSKEVKNAFKSKRKVADFIERIEKPPAGISAAERVVYDIDDDNDSLSDNPEIVYDDNNVRESGEEEEDMQMEDAVMSSLNESLEESRVQDSDDEDNGHGTRGALPYMRDFDSGIQYRKLDSNSVLVSIEPFKKLYFAGKALVQVLKGVVDVYGYQFGVDGKKYTVFSAKGHSSLVCVKVLTRKSTNTGTGRPLSSTQLENIGVSMDELTNAQGALVILEGFENEWCDGLRHTYPDATEMIGPPITGIGPGRLPMQKNFMDKLGFRFIKNVNADKHKLLNFPSYWEEIFNDLTNQYDCSNGKICPFGGKGVGKSTFVKWLTNRFLSRQNGGEVLFIDLDPGQTEFTPPGLISAHICTDPILGPNFTHLKDAARAVYLGTISVADLPMSYMKGVVELYEFCSTNERFQGIPWIVNTMGFSQGLGVHLACEIVKIVRPHCVIQININNDKRSFPFYLNKENVSKHKTFISSRLPEKYRLPLEDYNFLSVRSACSQERTNNSNVWGLNARVLREIVIISYFADKIGSAEAFNFRSVVPLRVPLDSIAIGTISSDLSYDDLIGTLVGNLVALCEMEESLFTLVEGTQKKFITKAAEHPNNCLGYGIVRAFDKKAETLFIVTPVSETDILLKVNVILAAGAIGLPMHFYVDSDARSGSASIQAPYLMNRQEGTSTLHAAAKKFFVPKRVTHNALKNCLL